ncbi:hypothetical protein [Limimaricola pyoseonensis]|uniref:hypothetical protein n=1 Tax=Limimaricola pyoseonensis TaxID=521013 RepID=UPI001041CC78|nr:hypothetical protein [Limimaricola pyoseonensis]
MPTKKSSEFRLQATAILAIRHGRELADGLSTMRDVPIGDLSLSALTGLLRRLADGEVTDGRDLITLEVLQRGLLERTASGVLGTKVEPSIIGHDEDGEMWGYVEVYVYTERGKQAKRVLEALENFLAVRQRLLDQAAAAKLITRLVR